MYTKQSIEVCIQSNPWSVVHDQSIDSSWQQHPPVSLVCSRVLPLQVHVQSSLDQVSMTSQLIALQHPPVSSISGRLLPLQNIPSNENKAVNQMVTWANRINCDKKYWPSPRSVQFQSVVHDQSVDSSWQQHPPVSLVSSRALSLQNIPTNENEVVNQMVRWGNRINCNKKYWPSQRSVQSNQLSMISWSIAVDSSVHQSVSSLAERCPCKTYRPMKISGQSNGQMDWPCPDQSRPVQLWY